MIIYKLIMQRNNRKHFVFSVIQSSPRHLLTLFVTDALERVTNAQNAHKKDEKVKNPIFFFVSIEKKKLRHEIMTSLPVGG